jgi:cytochrome b6-f complex iron-sulfur subunit
MSFFIDFLKSLAGICRTQPLSPDMWDLHGSKITIDLNNAPELGNPGGAVLLQGKGLRVPVLVVRTPDRGYLCIENRCTHMGRKLDPEPDGQTLRCCSVNHSTFDYQGNKLTGPAKGPIPVYRYEEDHGSLIIKLA